MEKLKPVYDISLSYKENRERGPVYDGDIPNVDLPQRYDFLGYKVGSVLGIPAGPLLDSRWIEFYSRFGYSILTYKTLRSFEKDAHPVPNIVFVEFNGFLREKDIGDIIYKTDMKPEKLEDLAITNSFGVPSPSPDFWKDDIKKAGESLRDSQILVVSVMGSDNSSKENLIDDYIKTASMAYESGAKILEVNLSCPNIGDKMVFLYQDPEFSYELAKELRDRFNIPIIFKVGYFMNIDKMVEFVKAVHRYIDAIAGINSVRMKVLNRDGSDALPPASDGSKRTYSGVCGPIILKLGMYFVEQLKMIRDDFSFDFRIIGMGGVSKPEDIRKYIFKGADFVQIATAIMWDPMIAYRYFLEEKVL